MKRIAILMFLIGALANSGCTPEDFSSGVSAYEQEDYPRALEIFTRLAEQGDADAQFALGVMYANGKGVPKDASQAAAWYRKAAEQGDAKAQFNLGLMYANGEGVPKDASQAVTWYRKAAEKGHARAQFNLGGMYYNGEGVPKDYVQAAKWFYLGKANGVEADKAIRQIESMMSHQQIEQAQALATQWWQNHH